MRFWDSSAVVPLVVEEPASVACRTLLRRDSAQVVWWSTRIEVLSALWRQHRLGRLDRQALRAAETRLHKLAARWAEVDAAPPVRQAAERLLRVHSLRAADALQLAAALVTAEQAPARLPFVSLDRALGGAAEAEGFSVLAPE